MSDYLSPSAWASIRALAEKLDGIKQSQTIQSVPLESYKTETTSTMQQNVKVSREDFYQRLDSFKMAFNSDTRGLGGRLDNGELKFIGMVDNSTQGSLQKRQDPRRNYTAVFGHSSTASPLPESFPGGQTQNDGILLTESGSGNKVARVEHQVDLMEQKVHLLVAKSNECAIGFAGLGFQSSSDSNAWLEKELKNHQSGLIVDAHMVFETLYHNINGINTLGTMEKLYKIKISCIANSLAITSFDNKMPKYFSTLKGHHVLRNNFSYFDSIISHSDWADIATGFKMRLQTSLAEFSNSHGELIDQAITIGSNAHSLAQSALTESVAWITGFIQFIDDYYRELSKAKFGAGKAWLLTTQLTKRVLDEVGTPSHGVQNSFHVGDSSQICQQIFWVVLRSHDGMTSFKSLSFKNHPSIATKLVKFLAFNTSFESIHQLVSKRALWKLKLLGAKGKSPTP